MSEIPSEIQCHFDAEKVCPLRNAQQQVEELYAGPLEERGTVEEFYGKIHAIANELSWFDKPRFYQLQGTSEAVGELSESCKLKGPSKGFVLFGKKICGSEVELRPWGAPSEA